MTTVDKYGKDAASWSGTKLWQLQLLSSQLTRWQQFR
jgi:hypothetical protein